MTMSLSQKTPNKSSVCDVNDQIFLKRMLVL